MYKTNFFNIYELVHPKIIRDIGEVNCWLRLDEGCLQDLDVIRRGWGSPILINTDKYVNRGLRQSVNPYAEYSVHKLGKAFDLVDANGDHKGLYHFIELLIMDGVLRAFNTMEARKHTPTWTHVAKMNTSETLLIINP